MIFATDWCIMDEMCVPPEQSRTAADAALRTYVRNQVSRNMRDSRCVEWKNAAVNENP